MNKTKQEKELEEKIKAFDKKLLHIVFTIGLSAITAILVTLRLLTK